MVVIRHKITLLKTVDNRKKSLFKSAKFQRRAVVRIDDYGKRVMFRLKKNQTCPSFSKVRLKESICDAHDHTSIVQQFIHRLFLKADLRLLMLWNAFVPGKSAASRCSSPVR